MTIDLLFLGLIELEALMLNNLELEARMPAPTQIELQIERERFENKIEEMERIYILPYNK